MVPRTVYRANRLWNDYSYIRPYHPSHKGRNKNHSEADELILRFKESQSGALMDACRAFAFTIRDLSLPRRVYLAMVPGHEARPSNSGRPMGTVISVLAEVLGTKYLPTPDAITRIETTPKLAHHGNRVTEALEQSLALKNPEKFAGRTVILLDDIATTGTSFKICRGLLEQIGCRVGCLALAETRYEKSRQLKLPF